MTSRSVRSVRSVSACPPDMSVRSAPFRGRTADTDTDNSRQQRAAEARLRGLAAERRALGDARFEALQLRRRAERLERVRERTRAAVAARQSRCRSDLDVLPFEEGIA